MRRLRAVQLRQPRQRNVPPVLPVAEGRDHLHCRTRPLRVRLGQGWTEHNTVDEVIGEHDGQRRRRVYLSHHAAPRRLDSPCWLLAIRPIAGHNVASTRWIDVRAAQLGLTTAPAPVLRLLSLGGVEHPLRYRAHPHYAIGSWRNIFIVSWRCNTTLDASNEVAEVCATFAAGHAEGIGLLTIIEDTAPPPPGKVRSRIAEFLGQADYIKASGVAMEGSGFRAATVRSVVAGLSMLARQPFPHKVFRDAHEALSWLVPELAKCTSVVISVAEAEQSVVNFRATVDRQVPKASG